MSSGFQGHRPSGKSSWPIVLVAGPEKTGKTYLVAEFTGSDLIGETFWIEFGEDSAEQYGGVPGARYVIADHDGTFNDVCRRAREAVAEPMRDGKPNCIVIDSVSIIWETLSAEAQQIANGRRKIEDVDAESKITSDVWNLVTDRWKKLLRILRSHNGPVILIARLDIVAVMDAAGQPTKEKMRKVKAQKALPYDVGVIVQIPEYRKFQLTGVRSLVLQMPPGKTFDLPDDFTLDGLMRNMGLPADGLTEPRTFVEPAPSAADAIEERGGGAPPDRPATRGRGRVDDQWTTPDPSPPITGDQLDQIAGGLKAVRGVADDAGRLAAVSAIVKRNITDATTLTRAEGNTILEVLRAEQHAKNTPPTAVGTPDNPPITRPQMQMMQATFGERGIRTPEDKRELIARVIGHPIASANDLSKTEANAVINALHTGEIPAPAHAADAADGSFELLADGIQAAADHTALNEIGLGIDEEHQAGRLSDQDADLLHERVDAHRSTLTQAVAA
jgi:hypothetical protein